MQFELTEALIGDIIFAMEDQDYEFYIDTVEGVVAGGIDGLEGYFGENPEIDRDDDSRFISLPEWDSSDGFRLMERFAAQFRNPLIREELSFALGQGRGVFRAFKNAMNRHPEAEKLWFSFKDREMKREVVRWYNGLREEWGLEKIGMEPEDTADLVLEDFRFRPFCEGDLPKAEALHRFCLEESKKNLAENGVKGSAAAIVQESQALIDPGSGLFGNDAALPLALAAESGNSEFAGYVSGIVKDSTLYIQYLEVKEEYRGLGLGEALLLKFMDQFDGDEIDQALLDLPSWAEGFSRVLLREGFNPYAVRYRVRLGERE